MLRIKTVISNGLAYGKSIRIRNTSQKYDTHSSNSSLEISLFNKAIEASLSELENMEENLSSSDKEFVNIHKMLISDPMLKKDVEESIINDKLTASSAFSKVVDLYIKEFKEARTVYLLERVLDMEDIKRRVLSNLSNDEDDIIEGEFILVVDELYPSYLMKYSKEIIGVIALKGGFTSHSAILCKSREIPYVIVDDLDDIDGMIMIDTRRGTIIKNPNGKQIKEYENLRRDKENFTLKKIDGVSILCNASSNNDVKKAVKYNVDGVGLYRTELIFMNLDKPMSFEEQKKIYLEASTLLKDKEITFRTFDIGDDKQLSYIKTYHKGIDNYKNNPQIFEDQIRAILSSNIYNNVKIMFPMIESEEEFLYLKNWVLKIKDEMGNKNDIKIGMMLETKKAVFDIERFEGMDFMSLGTNDLTKELYNISREDQTNYSLYIVDLLKVLKNVCKICQKKQIELSICGELAGIKEVAIMLYKCGIRRFSVSAASASSLNAALLEEVSK